MGSGRLDQDLSDTATRRPFAVALGLSAALSMSLQPLVSKQVLMHYGGTPAVWSVVLVFFQAALLVGYGLAHVVSRRLDARRAGWVYVGLLLAAVATLPVRVAAPQLDGGASTLSVAAGLVLALGTAAGPVAIALFATGPLVQRWYAGSHPGVDPYPLYAASNLGSLLGLLAVPVAVEPWLRATAQADAWGVAFVTVAASVVWLVRGRGDPPPVAAAPPPSRLEIAGWILWSAIPSAALVAVTAHLTTDLAPVPLLWVVPLAAYFGTWVLAFGERGPAIGRAAIRVLPIVTAGIAAPTLMTVSTPVLPVAGLLLLWLVTVGLAFHGAASASRPPAADLTAFYLWIGVGGVVGGVAVALLAPLLLSRALDLPLVVVLAMLVLPKTEGPIGRGVWVFAGLAVLASVGSLSVAHSVERASLAIPMAPFAVLPLLYLLGLRRPRPAAWSLAALVVVGTLALESRRPALEVRRSFFAAYRVVEDPRTGLRWLAHGRTIHGAVDDAHPGECLPYHHRRSPAATMFAAQDRRGDRIAVVGLGIGCMADLAPPTTPIDFFEIDRDVEALARAHFDALASCGDRCTVTIGDGRLELSRAGPAYSLIVLDAFASSAIPVHLVTTEALQAYLSRLTDDGYIAVHVSNRLVDLAPTVAATAEAIGLHAEVGEWSPAPDEADTPYVRSRFVLLSRPGRGRGLPASTSFGPISALGRAAWTDAHASLLPLVLAANSTE